MPPLYESGRPRAVSKAVNLLWASLAVGLAKVALNLEDLNRGTPAVTIVVILTTLAVMALLVVNIAAGRNWARIALLVSFIVGLLPALAILTSELSRSTFLSTLSVAQFAMQGYALFLIFTLPGATWFRKVSEPRTNWWRTRSATFRTWSFVSSVWAIFVFLFYAVFDPHNYGTWRYMSAQDYAKMFFIMLLPTVAGLLMALYLRCRIGDGM